MGWDIYLEDHTAPIYCNYGQSLEEYKPEFLGDIPCTKPCYPAVQVPQHADGGTYAVGGTGRAQVSITYNYSEHYYRVLPGGLEGFLQGHKAKDVIPGLQEAVKELGVVRSGDYWESTPGNAGTMLNVLLSWAYLYPDAVFQVS